MPRFKAIPHVAGATSFVVLATILASAPGWSAELHAKTVKECNGELIASKAALEAAGESAQEFFHACWWESRKGQPTPIRSKHPAAKPERVNDVPRGDATEPPHAPTPDEANGIAPAPSRHAADTPAPAAAEKPRRDATEPPHAPTPSEANGTAPVVAPAPAPKTREATTPPSRAAAPAKPARLVRRRPRSTPTEVEAPTGPPKRPRVVVERPAPSPRRPRVAQPRSEPRPEPQKIVPDVAVAAKPAPLVQVGPSSVCVNVPVSVNGQALGQCVNLPIKLP